MKTELSLAMSMPRSPGRSSLSFGIAARTPSDRTSGLAVACRITPAATARRPFRRTVLRSSAAPSCTRATSRTLTGKPLTFLIVMSPNWAGRNRSVCEVTLNSRCCDSMRPPGSSRLLRRIASSTSCEVSRNPASFSASSQTRIAYLRSPKIRTSATPVTVCRRGLTTRLTTSLICSSDIVSLENARKITGKASASTLAITGSSIACGSRLRTRDVRSRTSAAAASASFSSRKRTEIWLWSARLIEVMTSTPSMPAIESSSGLEICDSITSAEAPG